MTKFRVLVVDDSVLILQIVREVFEADPQVEVTTVSDGRSALALMDGRPWNLVLLDIEMPEMTGLDVLEELKRRRQTQPVVAFTGDPTAELRERLATLGVYRVLPKPVDAQALQALVPKMSEKASRPGGPPPSGWPPSVNYSVAYQRFNGNLDLYRRSLARYLKEYGVWADRTEFARTFASTKDRDFFLHTIKGVAGYLGSEAITSAVDRLQRGEGVDAEESLLHALKRFAHEATTFLGVSSPKSLEPAIAALDKTEYWLRLLQKVQHHDGAVKDEPTPPLHPPLTATEAQTMEQVLALIEDYDFDAAQPLLEELAGMRKGR